MSIRFKPNFMKSTEASRNQTSPTTQPCPHSVASSRIRPVPEKLSKIVAAVGKSSRGFTVVGHQSQPRSRSRLRISSPFTFRDTKGIKLIPNELFEPDQSQRVEPGSDLPIAKPQLCSSPLDKPLPSLPCAFNSNKAFTNLSLLDSIDQPLRPSLSAQHSEIWPSLTPKRQGSSDMPTQNLKTKQVSLGESVIERVRKLNLNDADEIYEPVCSTPQPTFGDREQSPELHSSSANSLQSTEKRTEHPLHLHKRDRVDIASKQAPYIRQTKTSELRKRLSSSQMTGLDPKKLKIDSKKRDNNTPRSRLQHSFDLDETFQSKLSRSRSRSRSKHRVTAQGSPYSVSTRSPVDFEDDSQGLLTSMDRSTPEKMSCSEPFDSPSHSVSRISSLRYESLSPEVLIAREIRPLSTVTQKSNIPIPVNRKNQAGIEHNDVEVLPLTPSQKAKFNTKSDVTKEAVIEKFKNGSEEGQETEKSKLLPSTTQQRIGTGSDIGYYVQPIGEKSGRSSDAKSITGTEYDEEDGEVYKIKPLSQVAPKYGPRLKISTSAHQFLSDETGDIADDEIQRESRKRRSFKTFDKTISIANQWRCASQMKNPEQNSIEATQPKRISASDELHRNGQLGSERDLSVHGAAHSGHQPPVKPTSVACPPNTSTLVVQPVPMGDGFMTSGWPFHESAVVPFEALENNSDIDMSDNHQQQAIQSLDFAYTQEDTRKDDARVTEPQNVILRDNIPVNEETVGIRIRKKPNDLSQHGFRAPPRHSSRKPFDSIRGYDHIRNQQHHAVLGREPPPVEPSPAPAPKTKSPTNNAQNIPAISEFMEVPSSPTIPISSSTTSGKGVMSNIRSLFHRRNADNKTSFGKRQTSFGTVNSLAASPSISLPLPQPRTKIPRSPRVKHTTPTIFERRLARADSLSKPFLKHRNVMTVSTQPESQSHPNNQMHPVCSNQNNTNLDIPRKPLPSTNPLVASKVTAEPGEITTATNIVYQILNRAQDEPVTAKKLEFIELSKLMVQMLHTARDAEKSKEQALQSASKAQLECLRVRKEIIEVTTLVEKLLKSDNEEADVEVEADASNKPMLL